MQEIKKISLTEKLGHGILTRPGAVMYQGHTLPAFFVDCGNNASLLPTMTQYCTNFVQNMSFDHQAAQQYYVHIATGSPVADHGVAVEFGVHLQLAEHRAFEDDLEHANRWAIVIDDLTGRLVIIIDGTRAGNVLHRVTIRRPDILSNRVDLDEYIQELQAA